MPIRVHTVDDPLLTPARTAPRGTRTGSSRRARPAPVTMTRPVTSDLVELVRRAVVVVVGPAPPRTALTAASVTVEAAAGSTAVVEVTLRNRQAAAVVASPALQAFHGADGTIWSPPHQVSVTPRLLEPGAAATARLSLEVAEDIPPGTYAGGLAWLGVSGSLPLTVTVRAATGTAP